MKLPRLVRAISLPVIAALVALPAPARADSSVLQPFKADSGDSCPYGVTEGHLNWRHPGGVYAVDVRGTLVDRPVISETIACRNDWRYSVATFTAYSGRTIVDQEKRTADNQTVSFGFTLTTMSYTPIDLVVVRVCRHPRYGTEPPSYCGPAEPYRPPVTSAS